VTLQMMCEVKGQAYVVESSTRVADLNDLDGGIGAFFDI
jgi:hypothetical protein